MIHSVDVSALLQQQLHDVCVTGAGGGQQGSESFLFAENITKSKKINTNGSFKPKKHLEEGDERSPGLQC